MLRGGEEGGKVPKRCVTHKRRSRMFHGNIYSAIKVRAFKIKVTTDLLLMTLLGSINVE